MNSFIPGPSEEVKYEQYSVVPQHSDEQMPAKIVAHDMGWDVGVYGPFWIGHYTCVYLSRRRAELQWPLIILRKVTSDHFIMLEQACKMECKRLEKQPAWRREDSETWEDWSSRYNSFVMPRLRAMLDHSRSHIKKTISSLPSDLWTYISFQQIEYEFDTETDDELIEFDTDIEDNDE